MGFRKALTVIGAALAVVGVVSWHGRSQAPASLVTPLRPPEKLLVSLAAGQESYAPLLEQIAASHGLTLEKVSRGADISIAPGSEGLELASSSVPVATLSGPDIVTEAPAPRLVSGTRKTLWNGKADIAVADLYASLVSVAADPAPRFTVKALGDVIMGRTVLSQMKRAGNDWLLPFRAMANDTQDADLTLADLESDLSDSIPPPADPYTMTFVGPTAQAKGLTYAGIDAVSLANNHSYNEGAAGFADTMQALNTAGIRYFGGGKNDAEAHAPLIMTVKGTKIALLAYSSIVGSSAATATRNGMAYYSAAPWGALEEAQLARMEADVRGAKQQADLVFVYFHWGAEYTHDPNADQRTVAHRMADAGADMIIGSHPHWVQGIEWYGGKLIAYSLGNFVFDQEWSTETKQGTYLKLTFAGKRLASASLVPYEIENFNQPRPVSADKATAILGDVYGHSFWP